MSSIINFQKNSETYDLFDIERIINTKKPLGRIITSPNEYTKDVRGLARGCIKGRRRDVNCFMMSCMEANVARVFMLFGEDVFYEPELFKLEIRAGYKWEYIGKESSYVPDFADSRKIFYEVKGSWNTGKISTRAILRICNFLEQYPTRELVLIQAGDFRDVFPGFKPRLRKIISYKTLENRYREYIDKHPLLCGWEYGTREQGFNLATHPEIFGNI